MILFELALDYFLLVDDYDFSREYIIFRELKIFEGVFDIYFIIPLICVDEGLFGHIFGEILEFVFLLFVGLDFVFGLSFEVYSFSLSCARSNTKVDFLGYGRSTLGAVEGC